MKSRFSIRDANIEVIFWLNCDLSVLLHNRLIDYSSEPWRQFLYSFSITFLHCVFVNESGKPTKSSKRFHSVCDTDKEY